MWAVRDEQIVTVALTAQTLTCCVVGKSGTTRHIMAFERVTLPHGIYEQAVIHNASYIGNAIDAFIRRNRVRGLPVAIAVTGGRVVESLVDLPMASPQPHDFQFPKLQTLVWDYRYLYPQDDARFTFYVCGISRQLILQYQLLAIKYNFTLMALTTERMALFQVYRAFRGHTFRASQFAQDMRACDNNLDRFFSHDMMRRMVVVPHTITLQEFANGAPLATALGLCMIGEL